MVTKVKHIHRLKKFKYKNGNSIFFCTLPDCHFKIESPLALGKECICNFCGEPFIMTEYSLRLTRPHCQNCGKKEIKDEDGKKFYINKRSTAVLEAIAVNDVRSLRDRLDNLTSKEDEEI